jgi:hypothetical protein
LIIFRCINNATSITLNKTMLKSENETRERSAAIPKTLNFQPVCSTHGHDTTKRPKKTKHKTEPLLLSLSRFGVTASAQTPAAAAAAAATR